MFRHRLARRQASKRDYQEILKRQDDIFVMVTQFSQDFQNLYQLNRLNPKPAELPVTFPLLGVILLSNVVLSVISVLLCYYLFT